MSSWQATLRASLAGGLAAGVVGAIFTLLVIEPTIRRALAIEDARTQPAHEHDAVLIGRGAQLAGGMFAVVATAMLLALVYAVALTRFRRSRDLGDLASALVVSSGCFAVAALAPGLKYPANPPAVGDPSTVSERTILYFGAIAIAALLLRALLAVAGTARRRNWPPLRTVWTAVIVLAGGLVVLFVGLPASPDGIPRDVGAGLVWQFRLGSLGMLALMWTTLGLVTGTLLTLTARRRHTTLQEKSAAFTDW